MVPSGSPWAPRRRAISPDRIPPTVRLTLRTGIGPWRTFSPRSMAGAHSWTSSQSSASSSTGTCLRVRERGTSGGRSIVARTIDRSTPRDFQCSIASSVSSSSARPIRSSKRRTPSRAISPRTSSATNIR